MKGLTFQNVGEVKLMDVAKPAIKDSDDALVRITMSAICGTDLHALHGGLPVTSGAVMGHEFVGVVEEAGPGVGRFKPGDRVVSCMYTFCGHCALCRKGWYVQCENRGFFGGGELIGGLGGGQSEFVVVPRADHTLEAIPAGVSDEQAIFVGDILATGMFGSERADIKPGDVVAVIGAGPVGLLTAMCAQLFGPARIFVVDMVAARLDLARELGGIPVDASQVHPVETIQSLTGGIGVDSSIECVGLITTVETAIDCVRGGGTVSMNGMPSVVSAEFPYMGFWLKTLTFRAGWCNVPPYMRPLLDLISAGRLHPEKIISHRMKLEEGEEAYRMFEAREATKIVLTP
jgi:2-desacetyl-2-hydroxyethyl bacteriochlorophyllide A dehydrogenase